MSLSTDNYKKLGLNFVPSAFDSAGIDNKPHPNSRIREYKFDVINLGTLRNIIPTAVLRKTLYNDIIFSRRKQNAFENIIIKNDNKIYETISELALNFYGDYSYFAPYKIRFETLNSNFFKPLLESRKTHLKSIDRNLPFSRIQFPANLSNTTSLTGAKLNYQPITIQNNVITSGYYITGYNSGINYDNRNTFLYKEFENEFLTNNLKLSIEDPEGGPSELVTYLNNQIFYPTTSSDVTLGGKDFETNTPVLHITGLGFNVQPTGLSITTPTKWRLTKRRAGGGTLGAFYWDLEQVISYPGTCGTGLCFKKTQIGSRLYTSSALASIPPTINATVPSGALGSIHDWVSSYNINFDFVSGSLSGYLPYPNSVTLWQYPVFQLNTVIALDSVYTYPEMYKDMNGLLVASLKSTTGTEKIVYVSPHQIQNKFVNTIVDNLELRLSKIQPKVVGKPPKYEYIQINSGITVNILDIGSEYVPSGQNIFDSGISLNPISVISKEVGFRFQIYKVQDNQKIYTVTRVLNYLTDPISGQTIINQNNIFITDQDKINEINSGIENFNSGINDKYKILNVLKQTTPLKDTWFYKFYSGLYTNNKTLATGTWDGTIPSGHSITLEYITTKDGRIGTNNEFRFFYKNYGDNSYIDQTIRNTFKNPLTTGSGNFIISEPVLKRGFGLSYNLRKSIEFSNNNLRKGINNSYLQLRKNLPSGIKIFPDNYKTRRFRNLYTTNTYDYETIESIPSGTYGCFKLSNKQVICIDPPPRN
jgi:hypothetical protein